ncbi:hypothetical protein OSB04_030140 [Centaurea solstitialis]|uniref:DDE Tnp4 domain-containing protein n=1 Tax=Centaurea solstitialis TaxID=347529 RepID=A0AA38VWE9_9ASTR|nr:hypothetical protein OSB04_030140 [Centaurea solstitialis]
MDELEELLVLIIGYWYLRRRSSRRVARVIDDRSTSIGHAYTQQLLGGSNALCHELMHVSRDTYVLLCHHFKQKNWLQSSRNISVEEKLAMFLTIIGQNERFTMVKRRFGRSTQTIHACFREVLQGMIKFAVDFFKTTSFVDAPNMPERYRKLREIFPVCVSFYIHCNTRSILNRGLFGALDGIPIHAVVQDGQQDKYKRKGSDECSQNVLAICNFNMLFTFVWAGWEGGADDSQVLTEVAFNPTTGFPFPPPDKYYLCDTAYTDLGHTRRPGFLAPYRKTRYSLADFRRQPPSTKKEKFNYAHAQLRNVIGCATGVLKARFPILKQMAPYSFTMQRDIAIACFTIHNFIRKSRVEDQLFIEFDENLMFIGEEQHEESDESSDEEESDEDGIDETWRSPREIECMVNLRDQIADRLSFGP